MIPRLFALQRGRMLPVRGTVSQVIVVKSPAPCFREAVFILRDEYLTDEGASREALLRQAREAASSFAPPPEPPAPRRWLWLLLFPVLALAGLKAFGVI